MTHTKTLREIESHAMALVSIPIEEARRSHSAVKATKMLVGLMVLTGLTPQAVRGHATPSMRIIRERGRRWMTATDWRRWNGTGMENLRDPLTTPVLGDGITVGLFNEILTLSRRRTGRITLETRREFGTTDPKQLRVWWLLICLERYNPVLRMSPVYFLQMITDDDGEAWDAINNNKAEDYGTRTTEQKRNDCETAAVIEGLRDGNEGRARSDID